MNTRPDEGTHSPAIATASTVPSRTINMQVAERLLAEAAVVADIECEGVSVSGGSTLPRTWDVRPMLDVREHHPISIDMNALGLAYAEWRGLIQVLERDANHQPVLVRIIRSPA